MKCVSKTHFEPLKTLFVDRAPKKIPLYEGKFVTGKDIAPGKYEVIVTKGYGCVYI